MTFSLTKNPPLHRFSFRIIDENDVFKRSGTDDGSHIGDDQGDDDDDDERFQTQEDRPQVAGIVDERPEIEIMKERFVTSNFQSVQEIKSEPLAVKSEPLDEEDQSPPRSRPRRQRHDSSASENQSPSPPRLRHDSSGSEPASPPRSNPNQRALPVIKTENDSDLSPPRRRPVDERGVSPDLSPPRRRPTEPRGVSQDLSPRRRRIKVEGDDDLSPPRRRIKAEEGESSSSNNPSQTLDGKKAGLQNAKALKHELSHLRAKERAMFETVSDFFGFCLEIVLYLFVWFQLSSDVSGRNAETKVRGRLKAKAEEEEQKRKEQEITEEVKAKYSRWSKG